MKNKKHSKAHEQEKQEDVDCECTERENPLDILITQALSKLKTMINVDTVIGSPVLIEDGTQVFPVIKTTVGFVAGGGEYLSNCMVKKHCTVYPFSGGTGAGFIAEPVGFLIAGKNGYEMITIKNGGIYTKLADKMADYLEKLTKESFNKNNN